MNIPTKTIPVIFAQPVESKKDMDALERAALDKNELAFLAARREIDWSQRSPEDFVRAVELALMAGAFVAGRNLAREGADRYPDHAELQKMAYILAPPKTITGGGTSITDRSADHAWLKAHWNDFRGQWVAVKSGQLLGTADSSEALLAQIGDIKGKSVLITPIM